MSDRTLTIRLSFEKPFLEELERVIERYVPENISVHVDNSDTGLESAIGNAIGVLFGMYLRKTFGDDAVLKMSDALNRNHAG